MASFLLGILTGMLIEECIRAMSRRGDRFIKRMEVLPDVVPFDGVRESGCSPNLRDSVKEEFVVLKDENNLSK